jgi:hypothetical protein
MQKNQQVEYSINNSKIDDDDDLIIAVDSTVVSKLQTEVSGCMTNRSVKRR